MATSEDGTWLRFFRQQNEERAILDREVEQHERLENELTSRHRAEQEALNTQQQLEIQELRARAKHLDARCRAFFNRPTGPASQPAPASARTTVAVSAGLTPARSAQTANSALGRATVISNSSGFSRGHQSATQATSEPVQAPTPSLVPIGTHVSDTTSSRHERIKLELARDFSNLHEDSDGNVYALCCYYEGCGANTTQLAAKRTEIKYPNMNVDSLRRHLNSGHGVRGTSVEWVAAKCTGEAIPNEVLSRINSWEPTAYDNHILINCGGVLQSMTSAEDESEGQAKDDTSVQAMFEKLRKSYLNLCQDSDGKMYALCCSLCGANTSCSRGGALHPTLDLRYMRSHLSKTHAEEMGNLTTDEVLQRCKGSAISDVDIMRFARGEPSSIDSRLQVIKRRVTPSKRSASLGNEGNSGVHESSVLHVANGTTPDISAQRMDSSAVQGLGRASSGPGRSVSRDLDGLMPTLHPSLYNPDSVFGAPAKLQRSSFYRSKAANKARSGYASDDSETLDEVQVKHRPSMVTNEEEDDCEFYG
ncbi:uncharacterized protein LTR77_010823 [Saxophila tyrrhenica]|uniref:Uncharacterized protein n=1 Tax=Saxophila tyrrhenica TaxID=1690608 RepID=A0AAV9NU85_9PEZI|nr:hypothetical protein LTR77_010823 [Saxophila tyrrhenica]